MILLELTEYEVEMVQKMLEVGWLNLVHEDYTHTEDENMSKACTSISQKIFDALKPKVDVLINHKDLNYIKSIANNFYQQLRSDTRISNKQVEEKDFSSISIAKATIMWLNQKQLLKNLAKFEFTDHSNEYEEME
jgi:hypothetical protein